MKIINDIIEFESADAALLSTEATDALTGYNGAVSAEAALNFAVNSHLELVRSVAVARELDAVKAALIAAPAVDKAAAQAKLDEAKAILGVQFIPKEDEIAVK